MKIEQTDTRIRVHVVFTEEIFLKVVEIAKNRTASFSQVVRELVMKGVEAYERKRVN